MAMEYIAYLHKDRKSDLGVSFPDFPMCVTAGKTLEEARVAVTRNPGNIAVMAAGIADPDSFTSASCLRPVRR